MQGSGPTVEGCCKTRVAESTGAQRSETGRAIPRRGGKCQWAENAALFVRRDVGAAFAIPDRRPVERSSGNREPARAQVFDPARGAQSSPVRIVRSSSIRGVQWV